MQALTNLRKHILETLGVESETLLTFVENGSVETYASSNPNANKNFNLSYKAVLFFKKTKHDPRYVFFVIGEWMNKFQPSRDKHAIQFDADILSHTEAALDFTLQLNETVNVDIHDDGKITFTSCFGGVKIPELLDVIINEK